MRRAGQLVSLVLSRTRKPRAKSFAEEPVQKEVFRWGGGGDSGLRGNSQVWVAFFILPS